jgi:hypothetical protein
MTGRRSVFSLIVFLVAAAALIDALSTSLSVRENLLSSVSEARADKEAFYLARNIEETFWQTLSETAKSCASCDPSALQALADSNVNEWKTFWEGEGIRFTGGVPNPATGFPTGGPQGRVVASVSELSAGKLFTFSVQGGGIFAIVGNGTTSAAILSGEERSCLAPETGGCDWNV